MTDEKLVELGNRLLEIKREKAMLTREYNGIKRELVDYMLEERASTIKRGALVFRLLERDKRNKPCKPYVSMGREVPRPKE